VGGQALHKKVSESRPMRPNSSATYVDDCYFDKHCTISVFEMSRPTDFQSFKSIFICCSSWNL